MEQKDERLGTWVVVLTAVLVRVAVSLGPYSGKGIPPRFGDYEAQRHWMELTVNLPAKDWYRETEDNDLTYWGLDYPPLSGYQSWVHGKFLQWADPDTVELRTSRGHETHQSKLLMRLTVLSTDLMVFFPAAVWASKTFTGSSSPYVRLMFLSCVLLAPPLVLIDHGHFQYNSLSLGVAMAAVVCVVKGWHVLGSVLYCCSINHKHMSLYFAPAFFGYLFGCCLKQQGVANKVLSTAKLGVTVVATFAFIWLPFLMEPGMLTVLQRLTPIRRGVFEDYVANFWCATNVVLKWKQLIAQQDMVKLCGCLTVLFSVPSMLHQILRPSARGFVYAMANSAMAFYMFAYQVHEKSILVPLLPITLLAESEPFIAKWIPLVASFSMYPLLERDCLPLQYIATVLFYACLPITFKSDRKPSKGSKSRSRSKRPTAGIMGKIGSIWVVFSVVVVVVLHVVRELVVAPARLPYLHDALCVSFCFGQFALLAVYLNVRQWQLPPQTEIVGAKKKSI